MITFDDVKRTTRETLVLFPSSHIDEVTHFMKLAGVLNECRILTYDEAKATYFRGTPIPSVPIDPRFASIPAAICKTPYLIVSYMDANDLRRKLQEIHQSEDCILWKRHCIDELNAAIQAENEDLKDWGPDLEWTGEKP